MIKTHMRERCTHIRRSKQQNSRTHKLYYRTVLELRLVKLWLVASESFFSSSTFHVRVHPVVEFSVQPSENCLKSASERLSVKLGTKWICRISEKPSDRVGAANFFLHTNTHTRGVKIILSNRCTMHSVQCQVK